MVVYDKKYALAANQGSPARTSNQYIVLHETGNANNVGTKSAVNEAIYMKRNWQSAYAHAIAGWDRVYIVGEPGYVAYGAGSPANERSPFQIELARYSDRNLALKAYANWINAAREYAAKYGIPLTLDGAGSGVKTHKWVSDNLWGDHQDPYAYLQSVGISKAQLASDIAHGIGSTKPSKASVAKPKPKHASNIPAGFTAETGTFINGDTKIMNRIGRPSTSAPKGGYLPPYGKWPYDSWAKIGKYTWIHHVYNGQHIYLPVRKWHGNSSTPWGTFK